MYIRDCICVYECQFVWSRSVCLLLCQTAVTSSSLPRRERDKASIFPPAWRKQATRICQSATRLLWISVQHVDPIEYFCVFETGPAFSVIRVFTVLIAFSLTPISHSGQTLERMRNRPPSSVCSSVSPPPFLTFLIDLLLSVWIKNILRVKRCLQHDLYYVQDASFSLEGTTKQIHI